MNSNQVNKRGISITLLEDIKKGMEGLSIKRLGSGLYYDPDSKCCCAVGAAMIYRMSEGKPITYGQVEQYREAFGATPCPGKWKDALGSLEGTCMPIFEANDTFNGTDEARYKHMLKWVNRELARV